MNVSGRDDNVVDITVVVTCYNEEDFVVDTIENVSGVLRKIGCSYEIIVIDDVSKDNSVERVRAFITSHPDLPVTLRVNERNRGLANNYIEGAFMGRGRYYRLCCGDNPEPGESLAALFSHLGKADMIVAYHNQDEIEGKHYMRKRISHLFTWLVNTISGYKIKYYNGSAIHLRYNVMRWHPSSYGFGFQADIVTTLLDEGVSYMQVPVRGAIDRKGRGSTSINLRNFLSVSHTLLEIAFRRLRRMMYGRTMPKPVEYHQSDER